MINRRSWASTIFFEKTRETYVGPTFCHGELELPFPTSKTVKLERVGGASGSRVACTELAASENSDRLNQDEDNFGIVRNLLFFRVCLRLV